jgi:hypothetical protein
MILKEMRKVFTVIVYLLFLFLIYVIDGLNFLFWFTVGLGVLVFFKGLRGQSVPRQRKQQRPLMAAERREKAKDEAIAMWCALDDED